MKDKQKILLCFLIPYTFIAILIDALFGNILGYLFMILCFVILSVELKKINQSNLVYIGILFSGMLSFYLTGIFLKAEDWTYYFTPFTPQLMIVMLSLFAMGIHAVISLRKD